MTGIGNMIAASVDCLPAVGAAVAVVAGVVVVGVAAAAAVVAVVLAAAVVAVVLAAVVVVVVAVVVLMAASGVVRPGAAEVRWSVPFPRHGSAATDATASVGTPS